jgi:hypothetical protein
MPKFAVLQSFAILLVAFSTGTCLCQCPLSRQGIIDFSQPIPSVSLLTVGDKSVSGKVVDGKGNAGVGTVTICIDATLAGTKLPVIGKGAFSSAPVAPLTAGQTVTAEFVSSAAGANPSDVLSIKVPTATIAAPFSPTSPFGMAVVG